MVYVFRGPSWFRLDTTPAPWRSATSASTTSVPRARLLLLCCVPVFCRRVSVVYSADGDARHLSRPAHRYGLLCRTPVKERMRSRAYVAAAWSDRHHAGGNVQRHHGQSVCAVQPKIGNPFKGHLPGTFSAKEPGIASCWSLAGSRHSSSVAPTTLIAAVSSQPQRTKRFRVMLTFNTLCRWPMDPRRCLALRFANATVVGSRFVRHRSNSWHPWCVHYHWSLIQQVAYIIPSSFRNFFSKHAV